MNSCKGIQSSMCESEEFRVCAWERPLLHSGRILRVVANCSASFLFCVCGLFCFCLSCCIYLSYSWCFCFGRWRWATGRMMNAVRIRENARLLPLDAWRGGAGQVQNSYQRIYLFCTYGVIKLF